MQDLLSGRSDSGLWKPATRIAHGSGQRARMPACLAAANIMVSGNILQRHFFSSINPAPKQNGLYTVHGLKPGFRWHPV